MTDDGAVLVIGGTGFVGRRVVAALTAAKLPVRCLVRDPARATVLTGDGRVAVVRGDMLDAQAVSAAARNVRAVLVCVHTVSRQPARRAGQDFIDVEQAGLANIIAACHANAVSRLLYVTSIGVAAGAHGSWTSGRARIEAMVFASGLDVTILRPGMIVGHGGDGFGLVERGARRRVAVLMSGSAQRFRAVAVDDVAQQLVALIDEPRSFGRHYDVGSDDVLTIGEMIDRAADQLGRPHPVKIHIPRRLIARLAPLLERIAKIPPGAIGGLAGDGSDADMVGDATPIRGLLAPPPVPFETALAQALHEGSTGTTDSPVTTGSTS